MSLGGALRHPAAHPALLEVVARAARTDRIHAGHPELRGFLQRGLPVHPRLRRAGCGRGRVQRAAPRPLRRRRGRGGLVFS